MGGWKHQLTSLGSNFPQTLILTTHVGCGHGLCFTVRILMAIVWQVGFLLVSGAVRCQVNHHIYSFTDLMATDSVSHTYTVAVPPPPGFLPHSPLHEEAGQETPEAVQNTAVAGLRQPSGDIRDTAPLKAASSQTSKIFLPTPLPTTFQQSVGTNQHSKSGMYLDIPCCRYTNSFVFRFIRVKVF